MEVFKWQGRTEDSAAQKKQPGGRRSGSCWHGTVNSYAQKSQQALRTKSDQPATET